LERICRIIGAAEAERIQYQTPAAGPQTLSPGNPAVRP
jgi:hypothetical protein